MTTGISTQTPPWLKKRLVANDVLGLTLKTLSEGRVHTVCGSSLCPNLNECFSNGQATFLLLGNICTRGCAFCSVEKRRIPRPVNADEPSEVLAAVKKMNIRYAVLTSVTRDDFEDGGAGRFADTIRLIRNYSEEIKIEALVPDFRGDRKAVETVLDAGPDVFAHNIETVERLYPAVRPGANYRRSLSLLRSAKDMDPGQLTKSSIMTGLGEDDDDLGLAMEDLRSAGCDILTIGQYLKPGKDNIDVVRYVTPREFESYKKKALELGFRYVASGPFVRSSYKAEKAYFECHKTQSHKSQVKFLTCDLVSCDL